MKMPYYTALTGSINNAGDFLIKHRAKALLSWLRPDRELLDVDAWTPIEGELLEKVNGSQALLLLGGPALQPKMYPGIYRLNASLDSITVPIVAMGIGWNSVSGEWVDTQHYRFTDQSRLLLDRLAGNGLTNSVRDYHSLNVMRCAGLDNVLMTGCPALYSQDHLGSNPVSPGEPTRIGFSLGACFRHSRGLDRQARDILLQLRSAFPNARLVVAFHHALDDAYLHSHRASRRFWQRQRAVADWLAAEGIEFVDISGSADKLIAFYRECDLHIGYRVHAHLFCSSVNIPSLLITEDGRGVAQSRVLGGANVAAFHSCNKSLLPDICHKMGLPFDRYAVNSDAAREVVHMAKYAARTGQPYAQVSGTISRLFPVMQQFVAQLP